MELESEGTEQRPLRLLIGTADTCPQLVDLLSQLRCLQLTLGLGFLFSHWFFLSFGTLPFEKKSLTTCKGELYFTRRTNLYLSEQDLKFFFPPTL